MDKEIIKKYIQEIFIKNKYYYKDDLIDELSEYLNKDFIYENIQDILDELNLYIINDELDYFARDIVTNKNYQDYYDFMADNTFSKKALDIYKKRLLNLKPYYAIQKFNLGTDPELIKDYLLRIDSDDYTKLIKFELTEEYLKEIISKLEEQIINAVNLDMSKKSIFVRLKRSSSINSIIKLYGLDNKYSNDILIEYINNYLK